MNKRANFGPFWLYFKCDSDKNNWGYKLYIEKTNKYIYETPHPYSDNMDDYHYKYFPDATKILVCSQTLQKKSLDLELSGLNTILFRNYKA